MLTSRVETIYNQWFQRNCDQLEATRVLHIATGVFVTITTKSDQSGIELLDKGLQRSVGPTQHQHYDLSCFS